MIYCTKYGKCTCCAYDNLCLAASSGGGRRWMVTRRRSKVEECREKLETTVANSSIKLCSDCRTSNTPLWRSGPEGPTSLCNACGIRYSKRKRSDRMEEEEARKMVAMSGKRENKPDLNAEATKKGHREKQEKLTVALSEEELRRRQREKQEKVLMVLLRHRHEARSSRRWLLARSAGGGESEEVAEAALLLLSLSCGIPVHS